MAGRPRHRAVLTGVATVTAAQFVFTYLPPMHAVFGSRPVSLLDGAAVVATGIALLLIVEVEKRVIAFASRGKPTMQTR